eukprot:843334_1
MAVSCPITCTVLCVMLTLLCISLHGLGKLSSIFIGVPHKIRRHTKAEPPFPYLNIFQRHREFNHLLMAWEQLAHTLNITYWIDYGTLLGCYRDKYWIIGDNDIDISIPFYEANKLRQAHQSPNIIPLSYQLTIWCSKHSHICAVFYDEITGLKMDIFTYEQCGTNNTYLCTSKANSWYKAHHQPLSPALVFDKNNLTNSYLQINQSLIYPLKTCIIDTVLTKCPYDTKQYLIETYVNIDPLHSVEKCIFVVIICWVLIIVLMCRYGPIWP